MDSSVYNSSDTASSKQHIIVARRELSQAMIPGKHLVKVEVARKIYDTKVEPILQATVSIE